ncbi:hypothetical protein OF846_001892 [Rhodotorula toruloides]|nr:hypothetical protein OF846_001892 [Rhodotorula toruloides]
MLVKSLVAAAALAGAVSAAPLPAPDKAQPSSGGGYGHWPSNEDSPAAQPFSGGGYVSAVSPAERKDKNSLFRRQSHPFDPNDPVEGLAGILLQFGTSVLGIEVNEPCAQPCLQGWKDGVESCTNPNDEGDYKTSVKCACRKDNIALLQTCANCMGGVNVQTGQAFVQQCPVALKALDGSSSGVSSQASRTGSLSSFSSALVASASSFKVSSSVVQTSAGTSRPAATGTNATQPAQTGEPAPGGADKTAASLLTLGAAGLAYLLV